VYVDRHSRDVHTLTSDINNTSTDTCPEITADNVVLDGNGHAISGDDDRTEGVYAHGIALESRNVIRDNLAIGNTAANDDGLGDAAG
jgi:hypothetical protein